ncbi:cytochrome c biogenesis protein CcdA [Gryllotalpicola sp.]|uniref:cytochrome c biogenesis CcdA family protein n=1 Tax=Gryllotalpicola sp. TaxID=1932787 RepID=UPI002630098E|nr:cytochrome c biogenesis protein CcdA [Gryllotalpicola sp.]
MSSTVVGYAFALGLVGVLNPCGFPLLPAYLSLFATGENVGWHERLLRGLRAGGCMAAGFLVVFTVLGMAAASAVSAILNWVPWLMMVIGAGFVVVGVITAIGRTVALHVPSLGFRAGRGALAMTGFGVSYALGSLSCSLPLFLAGVIGVFSRASFFGGLLAFVAYALGMGVFVTAASVVASFTGAAAVRRLRPLTAVLPRVAGVVLALAGAYLLYYWRHEILTPTARSGVVDAVQAVQNAVSSWISTAALPVGLALAGLVVAGLAALAIVSARISRKSEKTDA